MNNKPISTCSESLDGDDQLLIGQIRNIATALVDGPARWEELHARIVEAKKRRLHVKMKIRWSEFLRLFSLTDDNWSRIRVAVDICSAFRNEGLPLPRNHGQLDQLRSFRNDKPALIKFWRRVIDAHGDVPPAKIISGMKAANPTALTREHQNDVVKSRVEPQSLHTSECAQLASEYLDLLRRGEVTSAQVPAQRLAAAILGIDTRNNDWPIWPKPEISPFKETVPIDLFREICGESGFTAETALEARARDAGTPGCLARLESQLLRTSEPDKSSTNTNRASEAFRETRGETVTPPLAATLDPVSVAPPDSDANEAIFAPEKQPEVKTLDEVVETNGAITGLPQRRGEVGMAPTSADQVGSYTLLCSTNRDFHWGPKEDYLGSEFTRAGAKVIAEAMIDSVGIRTTLLVIPGESEWKSNCPIPPGFKRIGDNSTIIFERVFPIERLPRLAEEIDFAQKFLTSNGNLGLLEKFLDPEIVKAAKVWVSEHSHQENSAA